MPRANGDLREKGVGVRPGADIKQTSSDRRTYRQNMAFGVASGALFMLGDTLIHPTIVLALFVSQISSSNMLVGLVPALATGVWYLPQLLCAALVQGRPRLLPFATWSLALRTVAIIAFGILGFSVGDRHPSFLLVAFFVCYSIYNLAAGFANVPTVDVLARAVPGNRLGFLFGQRNLWGGVLGFLAGFLIQDILARKNQFPANFALLFLASATALALGVYATARLREPAMTYQPQRSTLANQLRAAPETIRNVPFRRFLSFRVLLSLATLADPFYIVYAERQLGAPATVVGVYISAMTIARFASNLFWSPLADRRGSRLVLQLSALIQMTVPLFALVLPSILRWGPIDSRIPSGSHLLAYLFGLVFVAYGLTNSGQALANMTYVLDFAPEQERTAYVGLINSILGVVAFIPLVGGTLLDYFGFQVLFSIAFLIDFAAVLASGALHEPRVAGAKSIISRPYRSLSRARLPRAKRRW